MKRSHDPDYSPTRSTGSQETEPTVLSPNLAPDHVLVAALVTTSGWPVLALHRKSKRPAHDGSAEGNHHDHWLTSVEDVLDANLLHADYRTRLVGCQYAAMTGQPNAEGLALVALDVDGDDEALDALLAEAGPEAQEWARDTLRVQRCESRMHLWGTVPAGLCPTTGDLALGLEWRGDGGYVLLAGSAHPSGDRYAITGGRYEFTEGHQPEGAFYAGITDPDKDDPVGTVAWVHPLPIPECLIAVVRGRLGPPSVLPRRTEAEIREMHARQRELNRQNGYAAPEPAASAPHRPAPKSGSRTPQLRIEGLARGVVKALPQLGNKRLLGAARLSAALCTVYPDDTPSRDEVETELVAAYLERPLGSESPGQRTSEAHRTVSSGWDYGVENAVEVLRKADSFSSLTGDDEGMSAISDEMEDWFWSTPILSKVLAASRARRVGRWAMLGTTMARCAACVPPSVVLPPIIGGQASLNFFVALCGESGDGKTAAMSASRVFLDATGGTANYYETGPGTGEGIIAGYVFTKKEKDKAPEVVQHRLSMLLYADEVTALGSLKDRAGATLLPVMKTAWMGEMLGTQNAGMDNRRHVDAHTYRLVLVAGVQPANAGVILDDASGGFPQRWLWLPTYDADKVSWGEVVDEFVPWAWHVPGHDFTTTNPDGSITVGRRQTELVLPDVAITAILDAADARNRPIGSVAARGEALDGHALLNRTKVAATLALMHGRTEVSGEDWERAGVVMAVSDETRCSIEAVVSREAAITADRKALRAGRSAALSGEAETDEKIVRAMGVILAAFKKHGGEHSTNAAKKFAGRHKAVALEALDRLVDEELLVAEEREGRGGHRGSATVYYSLA